jgi:ribosomal protein L3 glutamine methyltransferase
MNEPITLSTQNLKDLIEEVAALLEIQPLSYGQGMQTALDEAAYLVSFVAGLPPDFDPDADNKPLTNQEIVRILTLLQQRIFEHRPMAYLLGQTWLSGVPFRVNEHTLIPRSPIAELIRERFSPWWAGEPSNILELCTGCGCLGILAAMEFDQACVDMSDIDSHALEVARDNIQMHSLEVRVTAINSDVYDQIPQKQYDIILANPPYVPLSEYADLPAEFRHEPKHALFSGTDGLDIPKRILLGATGYLAPQGILVLEVGQSAEALQARFPSHSFMWQALEEGGEGVCVLTQQECQSIYETEMKDGN